MLGHPFVFHSNPSIRSTNARASLQSFGSRPCHLAAKLHAILSALQMASRTTLLPRAVSFYRGPKNSDTRMDQG